MSDITTRLELPLLAANQAQKHVTHNEALLLIDGLVHLSAIDRVHAAPPAAPTEGDRYIVAPPAAGAWAGMENRIAEWRDGVWRFLAPLLGWIAYVAAERHVLIFDGAGWTDLKVRAAETLGVNATADAAHPLAVAGDATLLTAAANDHRLTVNKANAPATASLLLQDGYSGRAEIGLVGDDDLSIKVSADGAAWRQAMTVKRNTGFVGVGASSPAAPLTIDSGANTAPPGFGSVLIQGQINRERLEIRSGGVTPAAGVQGFAAVGDLASPQPVTHGLRLIAFLGSGWDGAQFVIPIPAQIEMIADGDWSPTAHGAAILFKTTPPGHPTGSERMRITGDGRIGVGVAAPSAMFEVAGPARVGRYARAALPSAVANGAGSIVYVEDDVGGAVLAFSDGIAWRRVTDRAAIT